MVKLMNLLLIGICIFLQYVASTPTKFPTTESTEAEILQQYLKEMKSKMNLAANPCEDFWEYSCQNLQKKLTSSKNHYEVIDIILETEPIDNADVQAQKFIKAWKQVEPYNITQIINEIDFLKKYKDWPNIPSDSHTPKDIARILGELSAINNGHIITYSPSAASLITLNLVITSSDSSELEMKLTSGVNVENEIRNMRHYITHQFSQHEYIGNENETHVFSIEDLKKNIPDFDWDEFLEPIIRAFQIPDNDTKSNYFQILSSVEELQDRVKFIQSLDSEILMKYLILNYCVYLNQYEWRLDAILYRKYYYKYFTADQKQFIYMIKHFNHTFNSHKNALQISETTNDNILKLMSDILQNPEKHFTEEYMNGIFGPWEMDSTKYYQNLYHFIHQIHKNNLNRDFGKPLPDLTIFLNFIEASYSTSFDIFSAVHNQPKLQYFINFTLRVWMEWFLNNLQLENREITLKCIKSYDYMVDRDKASYSASKMTYLEFLKYLNSDLIERKLELDVINEAGIGDYNQLFFIALAQNSYTVYHPFHDNSEFFLKHFDGFAKAFNCPIDSNWYTIEAKCKDLTEQECLPSNQNLELLPFKVPYCDPPTIKQEE